MNKKLMTFWIIASVVLALVAAPFSSASLNLTGTKKVSEIGMFQTSKFDAHYRVPRDIDVERLLVEEKALPLNANPTQIRSAVNEFMNEFNARNPDTPNPAKLRDLLDAEKAPGSPEVIPATNLKSLVVPVEFPNTTSITRCGNPAADFTGPLHNQIPAPGARDNNTAWYNDSSPELYNELYFGVGPNAGVIIHHPNLGDVDLRGNTMANYYLEQSEGAFQPTGMIYPQWLQAKEAEAYYGQDSCSGSNHNIYAQELVVEVLDAVVASNPNFKWENFDGNADGVVDNFTVIHAGMGQEAGGGIQGDFAIWSHASIVNWPDGYKVCTAGNSGCPDRDIYVREYSMDPEHIDIGVIAEEFGHAAFGLPDMYATDFQGSIANWAIMEAGSWNGILGGMQPAPFPLWFRMLVGWSKPAEWNFGDAQAQIQVGQHSLRPLGTEQGIKINLPNKEVVVNNEAGTGKGLWSTSGDLMNNTLTHEFNLAGTTAPVFSFMSYWDIETDWDYGFVEVSTDGGTTWTALDDIGAYFVTTDPNGNNPNNDPALTGYSAAPTELSFDLTAYAGQTIQLRLRYATDMAASLPGWWSDDFSLDDGATNLFSDNLEGGLGAWATDTWELVPYSLSYPRYYLVEWRNNSGFDRGLAYPYQTIYNDDDEWQVDRAPYTVPGMLLFFRDTSYTLDYTLNDAAIYDNPSWGPKEGILVVDSHWMPLTWDNQFYTPHNAPVRLSDRLQPGNATFTLQNTTPFTIRRVDSTATGNVLETKTFAALPAVSSFDDALGYYPGFAYYDLPGDADDGLYWWNKYTSVVVPAKGPYSTRVTWPDNTPATDLYGADIGGTILGTGNPGDDGVAFGLKLNIVEQAADGSWGLINVSNDSILHFYLPLIAR